MKVEKFHHKNQLKHNLKTTISTSKWEGPSGFYNPDYYVSGKSWLRMDIREFLAAFVSFCLFNAEIYFDSTT